MKRLLSLSMLVLVPVSVGLVLSPLSARADRVPAPPESCPPGAKAATSHCGPTCDPWTCTKNSDCREGTCQDRRLCLEKIQCAHRGGSFERTVVRGVCDGGSACSRGTCQTQRVCASGGQHSAPPGAVGQQPQASPTPSPAEPSGAAEDSPSAQPSGTEATSGNAQPEGTTSSGGPRQSESSGGCRLGGGGGSLPISVLVFTVLGLFIYGRGPRVG
jgi:hypothetical protein